jgi:hypothetical protein
VTADNPITIGLILPEVLGDMGGGEDDAQPLAADHLRASPGLQRGVVAGARCWACALATRSKVATARRSPRTTT